MFEVQTRWQPRERHDFAAYSSYMVSVAIRGYGMDTNTNDLNAIRQYLARQKDIADYNLPENLEKKAKPAGCVATTWRGKHVSMICFQTGRPLKRRSNQICGCSLLTFPRPRIRQFRDTSV